MAKRKTTVPPDEQDLKSVGTEVLPPAEDVVPAEEDMAAAPDPSREIPVSPDEDSGLAGEGSPDGDAAQEDALLEESDLSRADSPPSGEEFPTAPEEQQAAEVEQRRQAEAKARVDAELAEIHKMDPTINTVEDLLSMPSAKAFYDLVRKGNSFLDAFRLANFDRLQTARAEAARQQAMNNARGKDHLTGTGTPQGTGAATVPADEMRAFKLFNPTATEAEITAWYNKHKK